MTMANPPLQSNPDNYNNTDHRDALILRRLPPSLSIDSADTPTNRPLTLLEQESLNLLNRLKEFLATAPTRWSPPDAPGTIPFPNPQKHPALNRFALPSGEYVTCVLWQGLYHISGTDIVRALVFRFEAFGRPVRNMKKFEEGVFSDLRNLKPGADACLEEPKSPFLDLLYKYQCIRTQKKQKVFYWFSVPHDRLFLDALERDLKREKVGLEAATCLAGEPALSYKYDGSSGKTLWEEWFGKVKEAKAESMRDQDDSSIPSGPMNAASASSMGVINGVISSADRLMQSAALEYGSNTSAHGPRSNPRDIPQDQAGGGHWGGMLELFEGSPSYKQRRKKRGSGPSRLNSRDKDRGRGVRKSSKDPEEERDSSASGGVPPVPALPATSDNGVHQGDIEMARRELQSSFPLPKRTESPMSIADIRASSSSPEQVANISASSSESAKFVAPQQQVRSLSFGAVPNGSEVPTRNGQPQVQTQNVQPRPSYHPYNRVPSQQQQRHTLSVLPAARGSVNRQIRPPDIQLVPHHATTLPAKMPAVSMPSTSNISLTSRGLHPGTSRRPVAFACPLDSCRELLKDRQAWEQHVSGHMRAGAIHGLTPETIHLCRVEVVDDVDDHAGSRNINSSARLSSAPHTPLQIENAQFAHAPPGTPEPSPFLSAQPGSSLAVSPSYWSGPASRPTSSGFASSPGSIYSGPPSSHSPSPPQETIDPPLNGQDSSISIQIEVPPRSPAFALQVPNPQTQARSAPSYKQTFDHASLYPQGYVPSPMGGPIVRPRSAVPEMQRTVESLISRPTTSMSYHSGGDYFPVMRPGETAPGAPFSAYSPVSATASNFSAADTMPPTPSQGNAAIPVVYHDDLQYQRQLSEIIHLDAASEPIGLRRDSVEYHSSPEMLDGRFTPSSHHNTPQEYTEYPMEDSPNDMWGASNYHPSPESAGEGLSPPSMQSITHVNPAAVVHTGMTDAEAQQLFSVS